MMKKNYNNILLRVIPLFLMLICICSCKQDKTMQMKQEETPNTKIENKNNEVKIYLYGNFPMDVAEKLKVSLAPIFGKVAICGILEEPKSAYCTETKRFATSFLNDVGKYRDKNELLLCLTTTDISLAEYKGRKNWGVMGLSYLGKGVSVISPYRLHGIQKLNIDNFYKLALHELGHAAGLPHCNNSHDCFMRDACGKNHFPELTCFCPSCKEFLINKGWNL